MPRYIDADKLIEHFDDVCRYAKPTNDYQRGCNDVFDWGVKIIKNMPTADVVPKSEVVKALNEVELLIIITKETYKQQMEDAPNELSKQSKRTKWIAFEKFYEQFAELKKKYTGDKE